MPDPLNWTVPFEKICLRATEIHVWRLNYLQPTSRIQELKHILSPDEKSRSESFKFDKDRTEFVTTRTALRLLLGNYLSVDPDQIIFEYRRGKPLLADKAIHFSISHSGGLALLAFTGSEVGVDIEFIRSVPNWADIAKTYFSKTEFSNLREIHPENIDEAFFTCWTRKESYAKARGQGLQISLDSFDVSIAPGSSFELHSADSQD